MKFTKFTKYIPDPASEIGSEDLLNALAEYLLQSGFQNPYSNFYELGEQTLDELKRAIEEALMRGDLLSEELQEQIEQMQAEGTLDELLQQLVDRLQQDDFITVDQPHDPAKQTAVEGQTGEAAPARFEVTDKSLDFLGFKTLRDLLASLGKSSFGRHDTRDTATGVEASGASKAYEFG